jgi:hypothetical protein
MANAIDAGYLKLSDLNLWFSVESGDRLYLSDIQAIIKLRFPYIVENWPTIKQAILSTLDNYSDPYRLQVETAKFSDLVAAQLAGSTVVPSESSLLAKYFTVFDSIEIASANISRSEQEIIEAEQKRVQAFTKTTFMEMRTYFVAARDAIADNIGGDDADYNRVYNRSSTSQTLNKSIDEIQFSAQFQQAIEAINGLLANESILKSTAALDPFAFARANANNPDFNIQTYASGSLIKMNYGETLQQLAARVFGDPDRWIDIAIANGLKPPYVDEVGVAVSLVSNGNGNRVNIARTGTGNVSNRDRFYINQIIILQSDVERSPDQRTIRSITEIPVSGELVLELSGEEDLAKYKTAENSYIRVYAPQTINSSLFVLIPSTTPLPEQVQKSTPWFLRSSGEDERRAGVDLRVGENGDLQFTPAGDAQLSYGAANAMQALMILLSTEAGSLVRHPGYGIASGVGDKNTGSTALRQKLAEAVGTQILNDPRFDRLKTLTVQSLDSASGYQVFVEVVLAGGASVIPISFTVNVG